MSTSLVIALVALSVFCFLGAAGIVVVLVRAREGAAPVPELPPAPRKPQAPRSIGEAVHDDDEVTIVTFSPIVLDASRATPVGAVERDGEMASAVMVASEEEPEEAADSENLLLVSVAGQTHKGRRRKNNQDSYLVLEEQQVFVVADGMGGYAGGEIASKLCCDTINEAFETGSFRGEVSDDVPALGAELVMAIQMANKAIYEVACRDEALLGMGTTAVGIRFAPDHDRMFVAHVGDSRCYRLRKGKYKQLTIDHTMGNLGVVGKTAAYLTRAVGIDTTVDVDVLVARPRVGDVMLLCSDGLNKMVSDEDVHDILSLDLPAADAAERLIVLANEAGGKDNITVLLVHVVSK